MTNTIYTQEQKDVIKKYQQEVISAIDNIDSANVEFKSLVEAVSEESGLSKEFVRKTYRTVYNQKVQDNLQEAEQIAFLTE